MKRLHFPLAKQTAISGFMLLDEDELLRVDERIDEVFHRAEPLVLGLEPKVFFLLLGICFPAC